MRLFVDVFVVAAGAGAGADAGDHDAAALQWLLSAYQSGHHRYHQLQRFDGGEPLHEWWLLQHLLLPHQLR